MENQNRPPINVAFLSHMKEASKKKLVKQAFIFCKKAFEQLNKQFHNTTNEVEKNVSNQQAAPLANNNPISQPNKPKKGILKKSGDKKVPKKKVKFNEQVMVSDGNKISYQKLNVEPKKKPTKIKRKLKASNTFVSLLHSKFEFLSRCGLLFGKKAENKSKKNQKIINQQTFDKLKINNNVLNILNKTIIGKEAFDKLGIK